MTVKKKPAPKRKAIEYTRPTTEQVELAKWIVGSTSKVRCARSVLKIADKTLIDHLRRDRVDPDREFARGFCAAPRCTDY